MMTMPSMCDSKGRMSIASLLDVFHDTAGLHAADHKIGAFDLAERGYFWIITRIRMHINRLPMASEEITACTWIQPADRASCERDYAIVKGDEMLAYARSTWAVISRENGRLVHMDEVYPKVEFDEPTPDDIPFTRPNKHFDDAEIMGEYKVRSIDIDTGGHFNNVNYVRAMLGCLSTEQIDAMDIKEIETHYFAQTYEGETFTFKSRKNDTGMDVGAVNSENVTVFMASIQ